MTDYKNELEQILDNFYFGICLSSNPQVEIEGDSVKEHSKKRAVEELEALLSQHSTEHIITNTPGSTFATCSCGKGFGTTSEQQQHIAWNLELAKAQHSKKRELEAETRLLEYLATSGPKYTHAAVMDELAYCKDRINQLGGQDETNKGE